MPGSPAGDVSKLLGHKDPSVTLKVYAHRFEGESSEGVMIALASSVFASAERCAPGHRAVHGA
jgi:hypothetical protein